MILPTTSRRSSPFVVFGLALAVALHGCAEDEPTPPVDDAADTKADDAGTDTDPTSADTDSETGDPPGACEGPSALRSIREVAEQSEDPCNPWLDRVRGRVGHNGGASMAVWSLRTEATVGLFVSANHVLGQDWYAPGGEAAQRRLELRGDAGIFRLELAAASGSLTQPAVGAAMFELFNPAIPADETGNQLRDITPRHDYFVGVVDGQTPEDAGGLGVYPDPITPTTPSLYDPDAIALADETWTTPTQGDHVMLAGYPAVEFPVDGGFSIGLVLSDAEAAEAIEWLQVQGDEEGSLPYDAEVEFIVHGAARSGMSGGGVFDNDGRLLGVMVRASQAQRDGVEYTRAVRMSWIIGDLQEAFAGLDAPGQADVLPYVGLELAQ